jgi:YggT family protein
MLAILQFVYFLVSSLLELLVWIVVAYAVLSWLISFQVINLRNQFVFSISRFLDAVARPILRPFQRIVPSLGGMDFSPILLILVVEGVQRYLLPAFFGWLETMVAGPVSL